MEVVMQTIYPTSLTPNQYAEQEHHKQVKAPGNCPNCQRAHTLEALAYYHRYITTATVLVLMIWVRRFLCRHCRISVSCLAPVVIGRNTRNCAPGQSSLWLAGRG